MHIVIFFVVVVVCSGFLFVCFEVVVFELGFLCVSLTLLEQAL